MCDVKQSWRPEVVFRITRTKYWASRSCTSGHFRPTGTIGFLLLTRSGRSWSAWNDTYGKTFVNASALTNVLRYHTRISSLHEDQKLPITELKWDVRTVTDILGKNAYWFFAFFWLTKSSRIKTKHIYYAKTHAHIFVKVFGYSGRHGDRKGW